MILVLWIICAFVCAAIADSKKRSMVGWFFIGLLIGVFGIILVAVLPSMAPEAQQSITYIQQPAPQPALVAPQSPIEALSHLASLHQQGVLTESEFDAKKQELLSRV